MNGGDLAGTGLGVVLAGVEADLVTVGVVQLGQDPADAGPVHPGVPLAQRGQPVRELVDRVLVRHADGEVVEARGGPGPGGIEPQAQPRAPVRVRQGDTQPVDVLGRDWAQAALTAPTAAERIAASAAVGRQIMERTGALFAVAQQAAAVEPLIAGFWQQGREQSRHANAVFWTRMAEDGLLDPGIDLAWVIDTSSILAAAETYLLITRMTGWDLDAYQDWLVSTATRLVTPPPPPPSSVPPVPPAS